MSDAEQGGADAGAPASPGAGPAQPAVLRSERAPDRPCDRCGTFAHLDAIRGRSLCAECIARRRLRIDEHPPTAVNLLNGVVKVIGALHFRIVAVVCLAEVPFALAFSWSDVPREVWYANAFVTILADMAVVHMTMALLRGETPSIRRSVVAALRRWPILVAVVALATLAMVGGLVLFIVPGIFLLLSFAAAAPIAMMEPVGPIEAMRRSFRRMKGVRWSLLAANAVVGFFAYMPSTVLTSLQTAIWEASFWAEMTEGEATFFSGAVAALWNVFVNPIPWIPVLVSRAVLYAQLPREEAGGAGITAGSLG